MTQPLCILFAMLLFTLGGAALILLVIGLVGLLAAALKPAPKLLKVQDEIHEIGSEARAEIKQTAASYKDKAAALIQRKE